MSEVYAPTLKYIGLAIREFTPALASLKQSASPADRKQLEDLLEMYSDIATKIDKYQLNFEDPNRFYPGELPLIEISFSDEIWENLSQLVARLLEKWKSDLTDLKNKAYLTEKNKEKLYKLQELIWPLDATIKAQGTLFSKYAPKGALIFPGETKKEENKSPVSENQEYVPLFPRALIEVAPGALKTLCEEFDFNYQHGKSNAAMLLLRKILPLSIVRKFQQIGKESEIKSDGEFLHTKDLLGMAQGIMSSSRIYDELINYKFLIDSSQHIFSISSYMEDIPRPATAIRILLEDFFKTEEHNPVTSASPAKSR